MPPHHTVVFYGSVSNRGGGRMLDSLGGLARTAAATLREQAAQARRLRRWISSEADRRKFSELADQWEAEAAELDRGGSGNVGQVIIPEPQARSARPYAA